MQTDAPEKTRAEIERAIETVLKFAIQNESRTRPTLEPFDIKNGALEFQNRSSFEKTLHFTKNWLFTLSPIYREKRKEKKKALSGALQESVELIKIYSSAIKHMQKGTTYERGLAEKMHQAISSYNTLVRQSKKSPLSLTGKIKQFFSELTGWKLDVELISSEIHLPETVEYSLEPPEPKAVGLSGHKVTVKKENRLKGLLENVYRMSAEEKIKPKKEEIDAFHLKGLTLLSNHKDKAAFDLSEIIELLHDTLVTSVAGPESQGYGTTAVILTQVLTPFPGEKIELTGQFQRDSFHPDLCFPIKESFKLFSSASLSGFPHPLQYIGFSLHEKLLPTFLLRPKALPKIQHLLEKNHKMARDLLHHSKTYIKAKELLQIRKTLFNTTPELLSLLQEVIVAMTAPSDILTSFFETARRHKNPFDFISQVHAEVVEKTIGDPIDELQREWLLNSNAEMHDPDYCKNMLELAMKRGMNSFEPKVKEYQQSLASQIAPLANSLYLLQLSEHLGFRPEKVTARERTLLISLFRQQLIFISEIEDDVDYETNLKLLLQEELSLFTGRSSNHPVTQKASNLADDLLDYFALG